MIFLAGVYYCGIKFSQIEGNSTKFAKLRSHKNFMAHGTFVLTLIIQGRSKMHILIGLREFAIKVRHTNDLT